MGEISGHGNLFGHLDLGTQGAVTGRESGLSIYGDVSGTGTIRDTTIYGNIDVGNSIGQLTLADVAIGSDNTVVTLEIGGADSSMYDTITLGSETTLAGNLEVQLIDSFLPQVGDTCSLFSLEPWHAGDRYTYNSGVDWYLWNYYVTGDRRSWDVALEHGNYVTSRNGGSRGRTASARAATAIAMYHATWEPRHLTRAVSVLKEICLSIEQADKQGYGSIPYHPHWERALDTPELGKPLLDRIHKAVILRAEDELSYGFENTSTRFSHHKLMGLAFRLSKDPRYLAWGDGVNRWLGWARYLGKDEQFQGYVAWAINLGTHSYYLQRMPYFLAARASHNGPVPGYTPPFMVSAAAQLVVKKDWPAGAGSTRVWLKAGVSDKPLVFAVKNAKGEQVHRQQALRDFTGRKHTRPTMAFDFPNRLPPGEYSIELRSPRSDAVGIVPCLPLPKSFPFKKVVLSVPQLGREQTFQFGRGVLYFFVPQGVKELKFISRAADGGHIATLRIERPEGGGWKQVGTVQDVGWPDWRRVVAKVRPLDAGRIWRVFHASALSSGTYHEARLWRESPREVPLLVSDRLDRFFLPVKSFPPAKR